MLRREPEKRPPRLSPRETRQLFLPAPGLPLAEAVGLTDHCVMRFAERTERDPRDVHERRRELAALIVERGVVTVDPPQWFFGGRGQTEFYVQIDGRWVLPVQRARQIAEASARLRPFVATTFISSDVTETELQKLRGEDLAALVLIPDAIAHEWLDKVKPVTRQPDDDPASRLRQALIENGRAHRETIGWIASRPPRGEGFYIDLPDGIVLVAGRGRRDTGVNAPYVVSALRVRDELATLTGDALVDAVRLDTKAVRQYASGDSSIPADARAHLTDRIRSEGRIGEGLPLWVPRGRSWDGLVLVVGDDVVLPLKGLDPAKATERWQARSCIRRAGRSTPSGSGASAS